MNELNTIKFQTTILNDITGRRAANFGHAGTSKPYNIWIVTKDKQVNAKSILGLLSADICKGDVITIVIDCDEPLEFDDIIKAINC